MLKNFHFGPYCAIQVLFIVKILGESTISLSKYDLAINYLP